MRGEEKGPELTGRRTLRASRGFSALLPAWWAVKVVGKKVRSQQSHEILPSITNLPVLCGVTDLVVGNLTRAKDGVEEVDEGGNSAARGRGDE